MTQTTESTELVHNCRIQLDRSTLDALDRHKGGLALQDPVYRADGVVGNPTRLVKTPGVDHAPPTVPRTASRSLLPPSDTLLSLRSWAVARLMFVAVQRRVQCELDVIQTQ